jgi:ElaB/YqjD/DUF883 family membrane-anchored ribosome-binding protein
MGQDTEELRRDIENTRAEMSGTLDAIGDRVIPSRVVQRNKNKVMVGAQSIRERVMGTATEAQHKLADVAHSAHDSATGTAGAAGDTIKHAPEAMVSRTEGAPMVAGALAFGLGFLAAVAFPASRTEKDASQKLIQSLEPVKEQARETAQEMVEHLKEPAMEAATAVKDAATESAGTVKEATMDAAQSTKQQATESVQAVRSGDATSG